MIEITDEMIEALRGPLAGSEDEFELRAALSAVAPLIAAQVRASDEDRMAGEILRAMMKADHGQFNMPLLGRQNGRWFMDKKAFGPERGEIVGDTISALHAAMVEAGMIGKEPTK